MFHDSGKVKGMAARRPAVGQSAALAATEAFCRMGVESAVLSKKLLDNIQKFCLGAASYKDAKDVGRAMAALVNSSYRDMSENAEAVFGIWARLVRELTSPADLS
jgi:hypothetical protein